MHRVSEPSSNVAPHVLPCGARRYAESNTPSVLIQIPKNSDRINRAGRNLLRPILTSFVVPLVLAAHQINAKAEALVTRTIYIMLIHVDVLSIYAMPIHFHVPSSRRVPHQRIPYSRDSLDFFPVQFARWRKSNGINPRESRAGFAFPN